MKFCVVSPDGSRAVIIECSEWRQDGAILLARIRKAVTRWIDTTPDGQRAKLESKGQFTFEDLAGYVPNAYLAGTALGGIFFECGVPYFNVYIADADHSVEMEGYTAESNLYLEE